MAKASDDLAILRRFVKNTDINWEQLLFINYDILLPRNANVVDIGANRGWHSRLFLEQVRCSQLAAFEPIPELQAILQNEFGKYPAFRLYPYALGNRSGHEKFLVKQGSLAESGLRQKHHYSDGRTADLKPIEVELRRLDDIDLGFTPAFIKIDIEGGEIDALLGAAKTIDSARPIISVEYGINGFSAFGYPGDALVNIVQRHDYQIYDLLGNKFDDMDEFVACQSQYYWDYVLVPSERVEELAPSFAKIAVAGRPLPIVRPPAAKEQRTVAAADISGREASVPSKKPAVAAINWLLVGGAARSGTTILMEILNTHPHIGLFAEFPLDKMLEWTGLYFSTEEAMNRFAVDSSQNTRPWRPWPVRDLHFTELAVAPFRAVFRDKDDLSVVGTKMPGIETRVDVQKIEAHFPDVKVIQIVRNPIDTVTSSIARRNATRLGKDTWYVSTVDQAISEWIRSWNAAIASRKARPHRTLLVKYEELETNFTDIMAEIANFLEVAAEFKPMFSPDLAARDLSPLSPEERNVLEQQFGVIDRCWRTTPLPRLLDVFEKFPMVFSEYQVGDRLLFKIGSNGQKYTLHGFSGPEEFGTWTIGPLAAVGLTIANQPQQAQLAMRFRVFSRTTAAAASCVVKVNGVTVGTLSAAPKTWGEEFEQLLPLPAATPAPDETLIEFEVSGERTIEECSAKDSRLIGIGLIELSISDGAEP
jgi:FkbM family methyltransferase